MSRIDRKNMAPEVRGVLGWDVITAAREMERRSPEIWKRMSTKTIQAPGGYYNSKALAVGLTGAIREFRVTMEEGKQVESNMGPIAGVLEEYDFPTYYVSSSLIEALKHSHPPAGKTWNDIRLPFSAMFFMVPRGSIIEPEPTKSDLIGIGVCRLPNDDHLKIPTVGRARNALHNRLTVFWLLGPSALETNDTTFPETEPLEPSAAWIEEKTAGRPYNGPPSTFASYIAGLAANFVLVMQARKELVEPGQRIGRAPKSRVELWSPTYIGRKYEILRKGPQPDAKSKFTELGWRAGHFKTQHFGIGLGETKTIWIEPYIAHVRGLTPREGVPG